MPCEAPWHGMTEAAWRAATTAVCGAAVPTASHEQAAQAGCAALAELSGGPAVGGRQRGVRLDEAVRLEAIVNAQAPPGWSKGGEIGEFGGEFGGDWL